MHTDSDRETETAADIGGRLAAAAAADPALRARLEGAGVRCEDVTSPADLAAVPVQSKDERVAERAHVLTGAAPKRIFQSPGPIYEAQPAGEDPWRWGEALTSAGLRPGDVVLNCFGYHLSPAGAMFDEAIIAAGGTVVPAGIGNQQLQVDAIRDLGARGYVGLPSYLKALIDLHLGAGGTAEDFPVEYALVTAEPLPDSLRAELERCVPAVRMAYGSAEAGLIAYEDGTGPGMVTGTGIDVSVCDLGTGEPRDAGEGEVVVTLVRETAPLVRFGTGDLSAWVTDAGGAPVTTPDGRRRLAGVLGRTGQAVKVRGMFLHPAQIRSLLEAVAEVQALRFVIDRTEHRDTVVCEAVPAVRDTGEQGAGDDAVRSALAEHIRSRLRFRAEVRIVTELAGEELICDLRTWD